MYYKSSVVYPVCDLHISKFRIIFCTLTAVMVQSSFDSKKVHSMLMISSFVDDSFHIMVIGHPQPM